jgi:Flp pilus assembly protein TadG
MNERLTVHTEHPTGERRDRGQILVLFALGLVAIIAMVGLVLDGGDTFAQRRGQQNGADFAALAGANAYMNRSGTVAQNTAAAITAARAAAHTNGYDQGTGGMTVDVNVSLLSAGAQVKVDIMKPHENSFARVMGMNTWDVSVTATAQAGAVDTGVGAAPWTMNINAFNPSGTPKYTSANPTAFGVTNGDYPVNQLDIAWTDYNGADNVNSAEVKRIIDGSNVITATIDFEQYIGQHNNGYHNTLFGDIQASLAGHDVPIPIVGPCPPSDPDHTDGCFKGWAMFHVVSASGGSDKTITGYFTGNFITQPLTVGECTPAMQAAGACGVIEADLPFGQYVVRLTE